MRGTRAWMTDGAGFGERTLFLRVPLGDGLDCAGEIAALGKAERDARAQESERGRGDGERAEAENIFRRDESAEAVRHRREAPQADEKRKPAADAEALDEPPANQVTEGVGEVEPGGDGAVVVFAPAEFFAEVGLEDAKDVAVDVIERDGEKNLCL